MAYTHVTLHEYRIPLESVRAAMRTAHVTQEELGKWAAEHNNGVPLSQSAVSQQLNGHRAVNPALVRTLEENFFAGEFAGALKEGSNLPAFARDLDAASPLPECECPPPYAKEDMPLVDFCPVHGMDDLYEEQGVVVGARPDLDGYWEEMDWEDRGYAIQASAVASMIGYSSESLDEPVQDSTANQAPLVVLRSFPLREAQKLADMARKAKRNEDLDTPFSMRKLKLWGECFYLLQESGFSVEESLSGGFHLAVEARTLPRSEERSFLRNAFETIFGMEPKVPKVHSSKAKADGNRHPMDYLVEPLVRAGVPVWLVGESATGKTWSVKDIARRLDRPCFRIQGTRGTREDDFVGGKEADSGSTYFAPGPQPEAMTQGGVLLIDEVSLIPSGELAFLQAVLEGDPLVLKMNRGQVVRPAPGFAVVVTDNTRGLGEGLEYVGTEVVNESIRDRFAFVEYDFMPPSQEREAVELHLNALLDRHGWEVEA